MSKLSNPIAMMLLTTAIAFGLTACNDDNAATEKTTMGSEQTDSATMDAGQESVDPATMDNDGQGSHDQAAPKTDQEMMGDAPEMSQGVVGETPDADSKQHQDK
ncbi:hypothetical protein [Vibrio gazogenes]|uniref:Secreted protein n=1 Tax=Vibrio gazogenes DSM 21264 = NBRC 103151 TaxID=1123492 RepID=A0A1M4SHZ8_VIBGA|nr:hypothetical protein [Vibrio gazogenes]USP15876.1 hypothetical protein MKS89_15885 [Vibrio gazogenes]SHE31820.1 hypothetical protein SAMN02745781_00074 [Vibrio gazogenes DSM 21264] [Vibrio gazogenes DSM 21264 = NBRC 103151]SJN57551.1 hypothetical protein BQ6471_02590 [Vibrio gazogenes]